MIVLMLMLVPFTINGKITNCHCSYDSSQRLKESKTGRKFVFKATMRKISGSTATASCLAAAAKPKQPLHGDRPVMSRPE